MTFLIEQVNLWFVDNISWSIKTNLQPQEPYTSRLCLHISTANIELILLLFNFHLTASINLNEITIECSFDASTGRRYLFKLALFTQMTNEDVYLNFITSIKNASSSCAKSGVECLIEIWKKSWDFSPQLHTFAPPSLPFKGYLWSVLHL